jgi:hypothetical protein
MTMKRQGRICRFTHSCERADAAIRKVLIYVDAKGLRPRLASLARAPTLDDIDQHSGKRRMQPRRSTEASDLLADSPMARPRQVRNKRDV